MKTNAIGLTAGIVSVPSKRGFGITSGNAEKAAATIATTNQSVVVFLIFDFVLNLGIIQ